VIDPLVPLVTADFGETSIVVDEHRPVAAPVTGSDIRFVIRPDARPPEGESEASVHTAPEGVWIVYPEGEDPNAPADSHGEPGRPNITCTGVFVG
jgi:hypothetical protein